MNQVRQIRARLGLTQQELADQLGCTQGNVGHYERGQTVPPDVAKRLIDVASKRSLKITFDHVYDLKPLPELRAASAAGNASAKVAP